MWTFANVSSTVCVSDDASCEKIRLSLENCEVEKDITSFIRDKGTGQEIPDPPKYINFCRGDVSDDGASDENEDNYSVAQFPRTSNPAYRSSSPNPSNPSTYQRQTTPPTESEEEEPTPKKSRALTRREKDKAKELARREREREEELDRNERRRSKDSRRGKTLAIEPDNTTPTKENDRSSKMLRHQTAPAQIASVPHNEYPLDGMTMYCRPQPQSDRSAASSPARPPSSHASGSDYTSTSSVSTDSTASSASVPPNPRQVGSVRGQQAIAAAPYVPDTPASEKKKSGFFNSPFRRKSKADRAQREILRQNAAIVAQQQAREQRPQIEHRGSWSPAVSQQQMQQAVQPMRHSMYQPQQTQHHSYSQPVRQQPQQPALLYDSQQRESPEPMDPRATLALNVGNNVFDVQPTDMQQNNQSPMKEDLPEKEEAEQELDPIAQALAELKGAAARKSADRFYGLQTPAPPATPGPSSAPTPKPIQPLTTAQTPSPLSAPHLRHTAVQAAQRGTPPPQYNPPKRSMLAAPAPAHTASQMIQATQKYVEQTHSMLESPVMPAVAQDIISRTGSSASNRQRAKTIDYQRAGSRQSQHSMRGNSFDERDYGRGPSPAPPSDRSQSPAPTQRGVPTPRATTPLPLVAGRGAPTPQPTNLVDPQPLVTTRGTPTPSPQVHEVQPLVMNRGAPTPTSQSRGTPTPGPQPQPLMTRNSQTPQPQQTMSRGAPTPQPQSLNKRHSHTPSPAPVQQHISRSPSPAPAHPAALIPARSPSPLPDRSVSPRPGLYGDQRNSYHSHQSMPPSPAGDPPHMDYNRSVSPAPYSHAQSRGPTRPATRAETRAETRAQSRAQSRPPTAKGGSGQYQAYSRAASPLPPSNNDMAITPFNARGHSPAPSTHSMGSYSRRHTTTSGSRTTMSNYPDDSMALRAYGRPETSYSIHSRDIPSPVHARARSKTTSSTPTPVPGVDLTRQFTDEGRPILHHSRALFSYTAAIPEELSFQKGDILAVLRLQDDGWWEAEIVGVQGAIGLVPSNYLTNI